MKDFDIADVRAFALLGHTGNGKTSLLDSLIHEMGATSRLGSPADGSSFLDYTDEEKHRKISVYAKPFSCTCKTDSGKQVELVAIDTPGYADFIGQVLAAKTVAGAGLIVLDAVSGIQVGDNRAWRQCESRSLPRGIVITGIDRENADFHKELAVVQEIWGNRCVPVSIPNSDNTKVVSVLGEDAPDDIAEEAKALKGKLVEFAAETDDTLLEKFFDDQPLTPEEIAAGLHEAVHAGSLIPVFAASATKQLGLHELLDGVCLLFPSPKDNGAEDAEGNELDVSPEAPFTGLVWKSVSDPFAGHLSFIRIKSGTLKADTEVFNATKGEKERVGHIYIQNGKNQESITEARAGDIVAIPKLKHTEINDSLCDVGADIKLPSIDFPKPVVAHSIEAKKHGEEDKMMVGLQRLCQADPTLHIERNAETSEFIFSGMGDVQMDVALEVMRSVAKVEVELHTPKIAYKETIIGQGEGRYRHKKQSGGRGQFGEVYLRVAPSKDEAWFENSVVGGAIPSNFIPAVQKGLVEGLTRGSLAGSPVVDVKVTVYDGSYHDVDSSEIAFKIAAARALTDALSKAKPVLLEPIMKVKVICPEQFMGDIHGSLNHKRGRILGMGMDDGMQVVEADVPQAELFKFSSELRSITSGRGFFEMEFSRYEIVPQNVAQKVVEAAKKDHVEEE